jgi:hypothetical protein
VPGLVFAGVVEDAGRGPVRALALLVAAVVVRLRPSLATPLVVAITAPATSATATTASATAPSGTAPEATAAAAISTVIDRESVGPGLLRATFSEVGQTARCGVVVEFSLARQEGQAFGVLQLHFDGLELWEETSKERVDETRIGNA